MSNKKKIRHQIDRYFIHTLGKIQDVTLNILIDVLNENHRL